MSFVPFIEKSPVTKISGLQGEKNTNKKSDSKVYAKRHENREMDGKNHSNSSQFSTPSKESDSEPMINMIKVTFSEKGIKITPRIHI